MFGREVAQSDEAPTIACTPNHDSWLTPRPGLPIISLRRALLFGSKHTSEAPGS